MYFLEGSEIVVELRLRTLTTNVHESASYRPRHTPLESEFRAPDSQFTQRLALAAVSSVPRAVLYELGTWPVRDKGRTKTTPVGRPHAAKSPETHSRAYIEQF